jgi:hypothetical protein
MCTVTELWHDYTATERAPVHMEFTRTIYLTAATMNFCDTYVSTRSRVAQAV